MRQSFGMNLRFPKIPSGIAVPLARSRWATGITKNTSSVVTGLFGFSVAFGGASLMLAYRNAFSQHQCCPSAASLALAVAAMPIAKDPWWQRGAEGSRCCPQTYYRVFSCNPVCIHPVHPVWSINYKPLCGTGTLCSLYSAFYNRS